MEILLDRQHKDWPARERLCHDLDIPYRRANGADASFGAIRASLSFLAKKPWGLPRLFSALSDYWDCKIYLRILEREGEKVRTGKNRDLVAHFIYQAGLNMVREPSCDWSEIVGLQSQKLAHLQYYEDFIGSRGRE